MSYMENPRHWRLRQQRYALIGESCPHCDAKIFPPRDTCPYCGGGTNVTASNHGEIYNYTVLENAANQPTPEQLPQAQGLPVISR